MKQWYVLQIYAGYEEKIKADLEYRIQHSELQDKFGEIMFPSAKMKQVFSEAEEENQQLFPGYMLVQVALSADTMKLVLGTPRVLRFLGGKNPVALSQREIDRVIEKVQGGVVLSGDQSGLAVDSEVTIADGPFSGFVGVIEKIDPESERVTVMVSIFGRMTPVELRFDQVKK
ncbi:MAG: transcription termination/antitermination factor NusG [Epsilonproteobacteria bacterium]|nr:transcription termination/antitermination factor NusG [Campylobacterota bacterium]|tara:strand:- start:335 stop:853 length:519 start_codon:yes stop_codon:yes gene_type:complete